MSIILGLKRSCRYFLPSSLFEPRRLTRQLFAPIFFYLLGWGAAAYAYAGIAEHEHINRVLTIALLVLLILKWWAGRFQPEDWFFQKDDGSWQRCRG
jgi:hypothetical protein